MLPVMAADSDSRSVVRPDSEKKLLCVNCELRTKSCTQSKTPRTSLSGVATPSRLIESCSPWVEGPPTTRVVNWKPESSHKSNKTPTEIYNGGTSYMIGYNTYFIQVLPSTDTNFRRDVAAIAQRLVLSPASLHLAPSHPPFFQKPT